MTDKQDQPPEDEEIQSDFETVTRDVSTEGMFDSPTKKHTYADTSPAGAPNIGIRQMPMLVVLKGPLKNQKFKLDKQVVAIGRNMSADILVKDSKSSRHHARIIYVNLDEKGQYPDCRLFDAGSTNGTYINGKKVGPRGAMLVDKDRIEVGKTVFGYFVRDAQELSMSEDMDKASTHDKLTGLFNRSIFERVLRRETERARRYQRNLSLMVVNVGRFLDLDEQHGSGCADEILTQLSPFVESCLRTHDLIARIADTELGVIMPETESEAAIVVAQRLCDSITKESFTFNMRVISETATAGLASLNWDLESPHELLTEARTALARANDQGGPLAILYDPNEAESS